ncbi:MAG: polysaccharide deacetylase family protein [Clostridia bacterium]|nr:polysaccharide deacetylase family protein [Clostridia bacterium]
MKPSFYQGILRKCMFASVLAGFFFAVPASAVSVPILMYHDFVPDDAVCGEYAVTESRFREHLCALDQAGYESVTFADVIAYADGEGELPPKPVLITADDGYTGVLAIAVPLADSFGMTVSAAVIGSMAGDEGHFSLEEAYVPRTEIVSHTFDLHGADGCIVPDEILREDIARMRAFAGGAFPMTAQVFVYPYGAYSARTEEVLRAAGYRVSVTCDRGTAQVTHGSDLFALPRIGVYQTMDAGDLLAALGEKRPAAE